MTPATRQPGREVPLSQVTGLPKTGHALSVRAMQPEPGACTAACQRLCANSISERQSAPRNNNRSALPNPAVLRSSGAAARRRGRALRPLPPKARPGARPHAQAHRRSARLTRDADRYCTEAVFSPPIVQLAAAASRPPCRAPLRGGFASLDPSSTRTDLGTCEKDEPDQARASCPLRLPAAGRVSPARRMG